MEDKTGLLNFLLTLQDQRKSLNSYFPQEIRFDYNTFFGETSMKTAYRVIIYPYISDNTASGKISRVASL